MTEALLEAYPEAARARDRNGQLPLHWAVLQAGSFEHSFKSVTPVIQALLVAYPRGAMAWDVEGNLALHGAAVDNAAVDVLQVLIEAHPAAAGARNLAGETPLDLARLVAAPGSYSSSEPGGRLALLEAAAAAVPETDVIPKEDAGSMGGIVSAATGDGLRLTSSLTMPSQIAALPEQPETADEVAELRARVAALEEELATEREAASRAATEREAASRAPTEWEDLGA